MKPLSYLFRCLLAGEVLPYKPKKVLVFKSFTEGVWFKKRVKSVAHQSRKNVAKQFANG